MTDADMITFAERFVSTLEGDSAEAARPFYAPDAKIWHNSDRLEQTVDQNLKVLGWFIKTTRERRYRVTWRVAIPGAFIQQHVLECLLPDGLQFQLHACAIVFVSNDRITRVEEYLDSGQAAVLRNFGR